jgi:hypothetical protein
MREDGPFDRKSQRRDGRPAKGCPKPDFVRANLTPQELHAYYIALISSARVWAEPDGLHLKAS